MKVVAPISDAGRHAVRRRGGRRARRAAPERARARGGRRRQRRAHGDRSQLDRRQAPALEADRQDRPLARRAAVAVQPRGGRDGRVPDGKATQSQEVRAGSSYLSSEDQQLHFGLGLATRARASVSVRYPWGGESVLRNVRADRVVAIKVPRQRAVHVAAPASYRLPACTPATGGRSIATVWDETAVDALRSGGASEPVQARDLFDVSSAMWDAWKTSAPDGTSARDAAISYAAYRVLLWQASFDSNLSRTFARLTRELRALCYSPDFTTHERTVAGGAGKPDRGSSDRRRPARRLERVAALRRPDVHVAEPAPDRPRSRLHRGGRDLLAAAGARGDPAAQPGGGAGGCPELRRRGVGPRTQLRASPFAPGPSHRPGCATAAGSVERRVQARRGGRPARDLGRRSRAAGMVAADLELARRPRRDRATSPRTSGSTSASTAHSTTPRSPPGERSAPTSRRDRSR